MSGSYEGQITVLLGHNGAGKSTLINVLTGLYDVTKGDAFIYGNSLRNSLDLVRKNLGVCPQQNLLIPQLTCREHLSLFGHLRNIPEEELKEQIETLLADVALWLVSHRRSTWSTREMRRCRRSRAE